MSANNQLNHLPLQAIPPNLIGIASALRFGIGNQRDDILDLRPDTACRNAVAMVRYASPTLERSILILAPFAILGYGIYTYVWKGLDLKEVINYVRSRFIASVTVPAKYALHDQVLTWMAKNDVGVDARSATVHWAGAVTTVAPPVGSEFPIDFGAYPRPTSWSKALYPYPTAGNVPAQSKSTSLSYIPAIGSTSFSFNGHSLWVQRDNPTQEEVLDSSGRSKGRTKSREADLTISCYSIFDGLDPVQDFLEHVNELNAVKNDSQVRIHRLSKYVAEGETWDPKIITRPIRKLDSVSMEEHKKQSLVDDIKTYLSPESKSWYANRGIPWRRGYLFYGPPGTGKTSFCTALAGHFDLDLYILPLSNPQISDDVLEMCFDALPPRCLVLLEDIDSAGIGRETTIKPKKKKKSKKTGLLPYAPVTTRRGVTLAGLLNTIDGPVSHEGRVLVMSSNSPDNLDAAMLRPGRIDRKVLFGNASSEVVKQLFLHIYAEAPQEATATEDSPKHDLPALAKEFADSIPEDKLTPAEIQNYLLEIREDPVGAVQNAQSWAEGVIETKSSGRNVEKFKDQVGAEENTPTKVNGGSHTNGIPEAWKAMLKANPNGNPYAASDGASAANAYPMSSFRLFPEADYSPFSSLSNGTANVSPTSKDLPVSSDTSQKNGISASWIDINGKSGNGTDGAGQSEEANDENDEEEAKVEEEEEEDDDEEDESDSDDDEQEQAQLQSQRIRAARATRKATRSLAQMRMNLERTCPSY